MKFAAHYLFDGQKLIKNIIITTDSQNCISLEINDFIIEKSSMLFYNGVLIPKFSTKIFNYQELQNFIEILLDMQIINNTLEKILSEFIFYLQPETLDFKLKNNVKTGFLLLENIDLQKLIINEKSILRNIN